MVGVWWRYLNRCSDPPSVFINNDDSLHPAINHQASKTTVATCGLRSYYHDLSCQCAMAILSKPIPALYTVYILRSTVRHASLYIGSTPHPPRRLKQHNGEARGGAVRTARDSLRPWEMVAIVSGFPGMVAALKFE